MKINKVLAILCASLICAAPLAGCAAGGGANGGEWWKTTGELNKDESGNMVFKNQSIKLTTVVSGEDVGPFQGLVDIFNDEYRGKIKVTVDNVAQADFETTVATNITQNYNPPDLIMSHQKEHRSYVETRLVQPFDTQIMQDSGITINLNEYSTGLAQYASAGYENKIYSIPCDAQSMVVFYNKDLLKEIKVANGQGGYTEESKYVDEQGNDILPKNHDELLQLCSDYVEQMHKQPITWTTTGQEHFYNYVFSTAIIQNGGKLYNDSTKRAEWSSDPDNAKAFEKAIRSVRDLIYSESDPTYAPFKIADATSLQAFLNREALFYVYLPWRINSLTTDCANTWGIDDDITNHIGATSIANWFAIKDDGESSYPADSDKIFVDSHYFAMSRTVEDVNKKAAILEFIKWFTQSSSVAKEWAKAGHITAYKPIAESNEYKNYSYCKNYLQKFYPDIDNFVCMGNTPHFKVLRSTIQSLCYDACQSKTVSINSLIAAKQNEFNGSLEDFDIYGSFESGTKI